MNYSSLAKRLRLPLGFVLAALYLAFARATPLTLVVGGLVALAGVLMRAWASGHIVKNQRLAVTGPYAHTRNPLYFGSFLIAAGFAIAVHWALLLLVIAFFAFIYAPTMERERQRMANTFAEEYPTYAENVPMFVPRPTPWQPAGAPVATPAAEEQADGGFDFALYMRHKEWKAFLVYLLAVAWLAYRMRSGA